MNEHIKQIAEHAGFDVYGWNEKEFEKFAELIVRECAEICLEANDHKNILRHFGVEE